MRRTDRRTRGGLPLLFLSVIVTAATLSAQFRGTRQLTSNNMIALAGQGDTLWVATERGFNYQLDLGSEEWYGFEADNLKNRFVGLAFGGKEAAALLYNENANNPVTFWHYDHESDRQKQTSFKFGYDLQQEVSISPRGIVYSSDHFWTACSTGGLVSFSPESNSVEAFRPGESASDPQKLAPDTLTPRYTTVLAVSGLDSSRLLVTAPSLLWSFDASENRWDTLLTDTALSSGEEFSSFEAAFTPLRGNEEIVYAYINVKKQDTTELGLYRYGRSSGEWSKVVSGTPELVSSGVQGYFYAVFGDNQLASFNDTLSDSADVDTPLEQQLGGSDFRTWLSKASDGVFPEMNDILFLPRGDSVGTLLFASSGGLFVVDSEKPFSDTRGEVFLVRHTRKITSRECYALPGMIRYSEGGRYDRAVFVYRLKKDGDVTIKIYDYNMSLVKTVVSGSRREAENSIGRSTNPEEDYWDGTDESGRLVSPGVYYFKLTSTGGDRLFGKVILAK
ncbi:MAG: hypothetical protein ACLFVQ_04025 [Chitinispirillaceae bacterium]